VSVMTVEAGRASIATCAWAQGEGGSDIETKNEREAS
jgi:hypothetical protein